MPNVKSTLPSYKHELENLREALIGQLPSEQLSVFDNDAKHLARTHTEPLKLKAGDQAIDFTLPNHEGTLISLQQLLDHSKVVLTFYRGVWCPYCNLQLKLFQSVLPQIEQLGAKLVAISAMNPDSSIAAVQQNALEYAVLCDSGNKVAQHYTSVFRNGEAPLNAMAELGYQFTEFYMDDSCEIAVPATFIVDQDHTIQFAQSEGGDYRNRVEPEAVLKRLREIYG